MDEIDSFIKNELPNTHYPQNTSVLRFTIYKGKQIDKDWLNEHPDIKLIYTGFNEKEINNIYISLITNTSKNKKSIILITENGILYRQDAISYDI